MIVSAALDDIEGKNANDIDKNKVTINSIRPKRDRLASPLHLFRNFVMKQSSHYNEIS